MDTNIPWKLIILHLKRETNSVQEAALNSWLTKQENNILYLELVSLWEEIQQESDLYHPDTEYYWKQFEIKISSKEDKKKRSFIPLRKFRIAITAASVLLALSVTTSYFIGKKISEPDVSTLMHRALNGKSQMILPDGSSVWLNKGSTLTYKTSFLTNRTIKLDGEALFEVKKDEKSPFIVDVNNVFIKVLGTRFNVQAYQEKTDIRIALLEGVISVQANNEEIKMQPGEITSFNRENKALTIEKEDVVYESFWAESSCIFIAKDLEYICKYLERWYNIKIFLDPAIGDSHVYTFTITDEPLETIFQIMSRINPIQYSFEENNQVIIKHVEP